MTTNLISDSPVPHKFQLLTAPSLVYDTQFHSKIIARLKIVFLLITFIIFLLQDCTTRLYDASEQISTRTVMHVGWMK